MNPALLALLGSGGTDQDTAGNVEDALLLHFLMSLAKRQAMKTDPREQEFGGEFPVRPRVEPLGGP